MYASVDESKIPYVGFHGTKQYIKGKPHKFGFKMWVATNSEGIPLFEEPYLQTSRTTDLESPVTS